MDDSDDDDDDDDDENDENTSSSVKMPSFAIIICNVELRTKLGDHSIDKQIIVTLKRLENEDRDKLLERLYEHILGQLDQVNSIQIKNEEDVVHSFNGGKQDISVKAIAIVDELPIELPPALESMSVKPSSIIESTRPRIYEKQQEVASRILHRVAAVLGCDSPAELRFMFDKVDYVVYTANFSSLKVQTQIRFVSQGLAENMEEAEKKIFITRSNTEPAPSFDLDSFRDRVKNNPKTLFTVIIDECHWVRTPSNLNITNVALTIRFAL